MPRTAPATITDYIAACTPEAQVILQHICAIIREAVPEAQEKISYQMPTFALEGNLIYVAAFKNHIGMYPPVHGDAELQAALERYKGEKGNLKFPLHEPMPYDLIRRVVAWRIKEHREQIAARRATKK
jgi:uncharacterized protein YdhG (YjbR/CyaY superfamily)